MGHLGKKSQTLLIPLYSTTILYDSAWLLDLASECQIRKFRDTLGGEIYSLTVWQLQAVFALFLNLCSLMGDIQNSNPVTIIMPERLLLLVFVMSIVHHKCCKAHHTVHVLPLITVYYACSMCVHMVVVTSCSLADYTVW